MSLHDQILDWLKRHKFFFWGFSLLTAFVYIITVLSSISSAIALYHSAYTAAFPTSNVNIVFVRQLGSQHDQVAFGQYVFIYNTGGAESGSFNFKVILGTQNVSGIIAPQILKDSDPNFDNKTNLTINRENNSTSWWLAVSLKGIAKHKWVMFYVVSPQNETYTPSQITANTSCNSSVIENIYSVRKYQSGSFSYNQTGLSLYDDGTCNIPDWIPIEVIYSGGTKGGQPQPYPVPLNATLLAGKSIDMNANFVYNSSYISYNLTNHSVNSTYRVS